MRGKPVISLFFAAWCLTLPSIAIASTTWYVNGVSGNDNNNCTSPTTACKTIGHAISLASSGDSITVAAATYIENLSIGKSLKIVGSGASATIIDGGGVGSVISIVSLGVDVALLKLTIQNGLAVNGGGIINPIGSKLKISNSIISGNGASGTVNGPGLGGGINNAGTLAVSTSILSGNFASGKQQGFAFGNGGAIFSSGTATITNSTLKGNTASGIGSGGAVYNSGTLTISHSTLSGDAALQGAGINNTNVLRVDDSTFSGNSGRLGSVHNGPNSPNPVPKLTISNVTVGDNGGVGIFNGVGTITIQNSIVAGNSSGNCNGSMTSNGYNLSSDGSCAFSGPGDMNNIDPMLGPLQNNGGRTQTMALPSGSPAVDAGNPSGCTDGNAHLLTTDQRGKPRPDKEDIGGCDMGAYESQTD